MTLPLDPGIGVVQRFGRRQEIVFIELRRALPLVLLVLVAPREAHAVARSPVDVPPPDSGLDATVVGLIVRRSTDVWVLPLLGLDRLRTGCFRLSVFAHTT